MSKAVWAEASPLTLVWRAPVECPLGSAVVQEVRQLLGPNSHVASTLVAEAQVTLLSDQRYQLTLHTTQGEITGERSFSAHSCRAVADAAIVTMALSLDPNLELPQGFGSAEQRGQPPNDVVREPDPAAATAVTAPPQPKPEAARLSSPVESKSARSRSGSYDVHWQLRSIVGWRWGALPNSTGEFGLGIGAKVGRVSAYAAASLSPTTTAYSHVASGSGGRFSMQAAEVGGCVALFDSKLDLLPCAGVAFTSIRAEGLNVTPKQAGRLDWFSPLAGLELRYRPAMRVALSLGAEALGNPHRPKAYVFDTDKIFQPDPVALLLRGGAELTIW